MNPVVPGLIFERILMIAVMSFCAISVLLVLGIVVRSSFSIFQRLFIPSSVIGGFIGLIVIQTLGQFMSDDWFAAFGQLPGFLINIVFAGLFLGAASTPLKKIWGAGCAAVLFRANQCWGTIRYRPWTGFCLSGAGFRGSGCLRQFA